MLLRSQLTPQEQGRCSSGTLAPEEPGSVLLRSPLRVGAPQEPGSVLLRSTPGSELLRSQGRSSSGAGARGGSCHERPSPTTRRSRLRSGQWPPNHCSQSASGSAALYIVQNYWTARSQTRTACEPGASRGQCPSQANQCQRHVLDAVTLTAKCCAKTRPQSWALQTQTCGATSNLLDGWRSLRSICPLNNISPLILSPMSMMKAKRHYDNRVLRVL